MATYIESGDITDTVLLDGGLSDELTAKLVKVNATGGAVEDLAEQFDVDAASIETDPVHYKLKEWAVAWVGMKLCFDLMGKANPDFPDNEKYKVKYNDYVAQLNSYRTEINYEILTGTVTDARHRGVGSGTLYRA